MNGGEGFKKGGKDGRRKQRAGGSGGQGETAEWQQLLSRNHICLTDEVKKHFISSPMRRTHTRPAGLLIYDLWLSVPDGGVLVVYVCV